VQAGRDRRGGHRSRSLSRSEPETAPRIRRAAHLFLRLDEEGPFDVASLLRGRLVVGRDTQIVAVSVPAGEETLLTRDELDALLEISELRWSSAEEHDASLVEAFRRRGLVVGEGDRGGDQLAAGAWQPYAALFHAVTRWRDATVGAFPEVVEPDAQEEIDRFLAEAGPPPPHFHERAEAVEVLELPVPTPRGGLYEALAARRTSRAFDPDAALTEEQLATLLHTVFGCHGTAPLHGEHRVLKKTSPSGGALHPVEAYPLLTAVEGFVPGLYHYRTRDHALELLAPLERVEARALAERLMCGQTGLAGAQAVFVLTARFARSFWKYRRHDKAYAALLMDVGHLSQTLYLVAAELGLGAFVTAAINNANVDELLGLDPVAEGALAMCGAGARSRDPSHLEPDFEPYSPPRRL
jgi:putative peptide maturation dehydrogenase